MTAALRPWLVSSHTEILLCATLDGADIGAQPLGLGVVPITRAIGVWCRRCSPGPPGTWQMAVCAVLPSRMFMPARTRVFMEFLTERMRTAIGAALDPALALPQGQKQLSPLRPVR